LLEVDEAEPLADVVTDDDQVWAEEPPVLGTGSVVEFEAVLTLPGADLEYKGLVHVPEQRDASLALELRPPVAYPPAWG